MDLQNFISWKYIQQIEYKSFSPEKINHEWIVSTPAVNKPANKIGFLISGILYAYSIDDMGGKEVSRFYYLPENKIIFAPKCVLYLNPSNVSLHYEQ